MPYLNVAEAETKMEILSLTYPALCTRHSVPHTTYEGRSTHVLRIRVGTRSNRPAIMLIGGVHAREWGSTDILLFLAEALLSSYTNNTDIVLGNLTVPAEELRMLLECVEYVIFPQVNPDGREYSQTVDEWWRKNRSPTSVATEYGTDLNRNYDWLWDFKTYYHPNVSPASDNPSYSVYYGAGPFSEAETQNVRDVLGMHPHVRLFVDVHSAGELVLYPWGDDATQTATPPQHFQNAAYDGLRGIVYDAEYLEYMRVVDQARYQTGAGRVASAIGQVRGRVYTAGPGATTLYIISGDSKDYAYARHLVDGTHEKIDAYLFEWGRRDYNPPQTSYFHPDYDTEMVHIIPEVTAGLIEVGKLACDLPYADARPDPLDFHKVRTDQPRTLQVTVHNGGANQIEILNIGTTGGEFATPGGSIGPLPAGADAGIPVTFQPTSDGPQIGWLSFDFRPVGVNGLTDDLRLQLTGAGCTVDKAKDCVAPVYSSPGWLACVLMLVVAPLILFFMALFIWVPGMKCKIKQFVFRMQHCFEGNDDPCIRL